MPKCQHCGSGIEGGEINYRPSSKGGFRQQSMRLCYKCMEKHDVTEGTRKMMMRVGAVVIAILLVGAAIFLAKR
ncbi:hypothetical protein AYO44_02580 [Planctomycetaceae bacterium SCGC AG-212-F19]|nr:hypothetical protein AYO44_02580 [Planctomycetaceae bacterium SCGC AG-212-F19]